MKKWLDQLLKRDDPDSDDCIGKYHICDNYNSDSTNVSGAQSEECYHKHASPRPSTDEFCCQPEKRKITSQII